MNRELVLDINQFKGVEEIYQFNYKLTLESRTFYFNLYRNEVEDEDKKLLLSKVLGGFYINTLGPININKLKKPF